MLCLKDTQWFRTLNDFRHIMIFGANEAASRTYRAIKFLHFDIDCYVVSKRNNNPFQLDGKPVKVFDEIYLEEKQDCIVVISQVYEKSRKMEKVLLRAGFKHIIPSVVQITLSEANELNRYRSSVLGKIERIDHIFERGDKKECPQICIYAVTSANNLHTAINSYQSKYIRYIQAGAALTDFFICDLADNTGDNISGKNPYYCEMTVGYWICKNDRQNSYVGLYHYSRGLAITDKQLESIVYGGIDAVLPIPGVLRHELITRGTEEEAYMVLKAVKQISPEYLTDAEKYFSSKLFFQGNIVIARKDIYCRYCEWMFLVLHKCETIWYENGNTTIPLRWHGYVAEYLTAIYFMHHLSEYNILYASVKSMI